MNSLPLVIENIVNEYKEELEYFDKLKECTKKIKKIEHIQKEYIKCIDIYLIKNNIQINHIKICKDCHNSCVVDSDYMYAEQCICYED